MSQKAAIDQFISRILYLHDSSYGDFKRKADLAMSRLWNSIGHANQQADQLLYEAKKELIYGPHKDIEDSRHQLLKTAEQLKKLLH